jgi:hypothetical protein
MFGRTPVQCLPSLRRSARRASSPSPGSTATAVEDAFIVALQLPEFPVHELWVDGNPQPVTGLLRYKENR